MLLDEIAPGSEVLVDGLRADPVIVSEAQEVCRPLEERTEIAGDSVGETGDWDEFLKKFFGEAP